MQKQIARQFTNLSVVLALAIALGAITACGGPDGTSVTATPPSTVAAAGQATGTTVQQGDDPPATATSEPSAAPPAEQPSATATGAPEVDSPTTGVSPSATTSPTADINPAGSILPNKRILSYYGHPNSAQMGILGEYTPDELLAKLRDQAAAYDAADPAHPVQPALELIASVAQADPGPDGTYLAYTDDAIIGQYVDFATQNGLIVILDIQIGWSTIKDEVERLRPWLEKPNVHLAIDPEFSTGPDRVPGTVIGEVDGSRVQGAVQFLSDLVREKGLPSKVLIVHQFEEDMVTNKDQITPLPGVDIVLDMDGFGGPDAKIKNYTYFVRDQLIEYGGIKLFYKQDDPLLTPEQVVSLDPAPLVVIYQ